MASDHGSIFFATQRRPWSITSPATPMEIMPTRMMSVRSTLRASEISQPSPEVAPTSSAATSAIQPTPRPTRMPVTICGSAARNTIFTSTSNSDAPRQRAARMTLCSTFFTPEMVLISSGKKMPRKMMNWFCRSPMPNHRMASGIQAIGGIGRSISNTGSNRFCAVFDQPISSPKGMATDA